MGILDKFQNAEAKKSLSDDLKSKVGIIASEIISEEIKPIAESAGEQTEEVKTQIGSEKPVEKEVEKVKGKGKVSTKIIGEVSKKRKETKKKEEKLELNESSDFENLPESELEAFVLNFRESYKQSEKEHRMINLQKKNYKNLIKLKVDIVSMSEFVNLAIALTLKSSNYKNIIKFLKKPT